MKTKVITNDRPILLGKCGENEATLIKFPINVFFPFVKASYYSLAHQRHGDVAPYLCVISKNDGVIDESGYEENPNGDATQTVLNDGFIDWPIKSADVANQGNGIAQLTAYNEEGLVAKTVVFTTVVTDSLGYVTPPAPQTAWVDQVAGYANQAELAAVQASESVAAIQNLGVSAETGSPVAVRKVIDPDTGAVNLIFTIPSGAAVTVDTALSSNSRNPVENRVISAALPLAQRLTGDIVVESRSTPAAVTETVTLAGNNYVFDVDEALRRHRPVFCFVEVDVQWYGYTLYEYKLELMARKFSNPYEPPEWEPPADDEEAPEPAFDSPAEYVEFYGEIPASVDGSYPGGKIILRCDITDAPNWYIKTFDVIYEQNASSAN